MTFIGEVCHLATIDLQSLFLHRFLQLMLALECKYSMAEESVVVSSNWRRDLQQSKVGDLPSPQSYCACTLLPSSELLVAGGHNSNGRTARVDVAVIWCRLIPGTAGPKGDSWSYAWAYQTMHFINYVAILEIKHSLCTKFIVVTRHNTAKFYSPNLRLPKLQINDIQTMHL